VPPLYRTYRFKVHDPNPGKALRLRGFASGVWRKGLNFCLEVAKQTRPDSSFDLHPHVYNRIRGFGLPSQHACDCRDKAFEAYASHRTLKRMGGVWRRFPHFGGAPAVRFNIPRSCRLFTRGGRHWVELTMPAGPVRLRVIGKPSALRKVWSANPRFAEIVFRGEDLYVHIVVAEQVRLPRVPDCLTLIGVDVNVLGHLIVAVARDLSGRVLGAFWARAGYFNHKRARFRKVREAIQAAGSSGRVRKLRRRERDFVRTYLHTVSRRFVQWAARFPSPLVALEDLRGIRGKVRASKSWNRKIHSWPFRSGQDMLGHKGRREGMRVRPFPGAFSSRYCSRCGSRNTRRSGALFACLSCGYELNVHLNGARGMSWRAFCYRQRAAGRADPARDPSVVKGWGRAMPETATGQSGPEAGGNARVHVSVLNNPLGRHFQALRKPRTSVRGS
jgi:putative transposase